MRRWRWPARWRDRRVYLVSHPVLFALLAVARRRPVTRWGRTVLVSAPEPFRQAVLRVPLDRTAPGTTGGAARAALRTSDGAGGGVLFDQAGDGHRSARRELAQALGPAGVARLRPVWTGPLERGLRPLAAGGTVDVVEVAREMAGATVCALLGSAADPRRVAAAAGRAAATAVAAGLPGARRVRQVEVASAAAELAQLLGTAEPRAAMLAVAAVGTTVAAVPRAVAWCADGRWWQAAGDAALRPALVEELLRVTAASPVLPRVAAGGAEVGGRRVRAGDRLVLVARSACGAHDRGPDPLRPAPPETGRLVFGAGSHSCPGARLARAQLADVLAALAPYAPVVAAARADRRAALPGWRRLVVRAGSAAGPAADGGSGAGGAEAGGPGSGDAGADGTGGGGPCAGGPGVAGAGGPGGVR